jgi:hypothetical protein
MEVVQKRKSELVITPEIERRHSDGKATHNTIPYPKLAAQFLYTNLYAYGKAPPAFEFPYPTERFEFSCAKLPWHSRSFLWRTF